MAHEIGEFDRMFSGSEVTPWHGLGTVVAGALTAQEAMQIAGLDYIVEKVPAAAWWNVSEEDTPPEFALIPGRYATVAHFQDDRQPLPLGTVGEDYTIIQNAEGFAFCDALVADGSALFETAGSLRNCRIVWMLMRLPEPIKIGTGDMILPYICFTNSHDGSFLLRVITTDIRVVCMNTLRAGIASAKTSFSTRHTSGIAGRVEEARRALQMSLQFAGDMSELGNALAAIPWSEQEVRQLAASLFPIPEKPEGFDTFDKLHKTLYEKARDKAFSDQLSILYNFRSDTCTNDGIAGTAWSGLNAATEFIDHSIPFSDETENARKKGIIPEKRFASMFGIMADPKIDGLKTQALTLTKELAGLC